MNVCIETEAACPTNPKTSVWLCPHAHPIQPPHIIMTSPRHLAGITTTSRWHHADILILPPTSLPPWATWSLFRRRLHGSRVASLDPFWWHCTPWNSQPENRPTKQSSNQPTMQLADQLIKTSNHTASQPHNPAITRQNRSTSRRAVNQTLNQRQNK